MNIMLINHYAGGDKYGMEFRPYYLARNWVKDGHDVTIIGANFSHLRKRNPEISKDFEEEYIDGIRYLWVKTNTYKGNNIGRVINVLTMVNKLNFKAKNIAKQYKPDVVIASSTYPYDIYPAKKIADEVNAKLFFEIHDLWPLTQIEINGLSEKNPLVKSLQKAENFCYENANVISILPNADEHIRELGYENVKYTHIPNGIVIEQEMLNPPEKIADFLKELKSEGKFITMYLGGLQSANALEELIESVNFLEDDKVIIIIGNGVKKQQYIDMVPDNAKHQIFFLDAISKLAVTKTLELADCLYIGAKKIPLYRYGVGMNKIFDYMFSAKPIIFGIQTGDNPIKNSGCGIVIDAADAKSISDAINHLANLSEQERAEMGQKGKEYVINNHDYVKLSQDFIDVIKE
jgi:glycosyltransferase involved in cell wall biosynthesis